MKYKAASLNADFIGIDRCAGDAVMKFNVSRASQLPLWVIEEPAGNL